MNDLRLRFLTRKACHLCDDARPLVESAATKARAELEVVDVDFSPELKTRYGDRVPVLLGPGDRVIAEGRIDDVRQLTRRIKRSARGAG